MAEVEWSPGRPEVVFVKGFDAWIEKLEAGLYALLKRFEPEIEAWMKANAPWSDITGNARQALAAEAERLISEAALHLMHGMDYGIYLEQSNQARYQILQPAIDFFAPLIWAAVVELFQ